MSLSRYPSGSVRELLAVALPLMLSSLSVLAMVFCDRLFLARFSPDAMSSAVTAGTASWAILGSCLILASMSEVFVAQYNGAGQHRRIGRPIWQMIWFSLALWAVLIPVAIWGGKLLFWGSPNFDLENTYFFWLVLFAGIYPLQGALTAFYIGRGKTKMVMYLTLFANVINVLLDWALIFGIDGLIEPMGVAGAAIATSIAQFFTPFVLICLFLRKENGERYGTRQIGLHWQELKKVLRIGSPQAMLFFVECMGWAYFYVMISHVGPEQIYVAGVCQSVLILFFFVAEGIGRGASAVAGNMIGAGTPEMTFKVFRAGLKVHIGFFFIASLFFVVFPQLVINLFTSDVFGPASDGPAELVLNQLNMDYVVGALKVTLQLCLFYLLFEGIRWLISGLLSAAGDTLFLFISGTLAVPLFLLLPNYFFVEKMQMSVEVAFIIANGFAFAVSTIFFLRYLGRRWQHIDLLTD